MSVADLSSPVEAVVLELTEMIKLGMAVPDAALAYARSNPSEMEEYRSSMKVCEIADLVIFLSSSC